MIPRFTHSSLSSLTIRQHLALFGLLTLLPIITVGAFLAVRYEEAERSKLNQTVVDLSRETAFAIDQELDSARAALEVLATSRSLVVKDFGNFDTKARTVVKFFPGAAVALRRLDGQQIINTYLPPGKPLSRTLDPALFQADREAIQSGSTKVSGVYIGAAGKVPFVAVVTPIEIDGEQLVLNIAIRASRLLEILAEKNLPGGWLVAVVDANNKIVARTREAEMFVGTNASADYVEKTRADKGTFFGKTRDGVRVFTAYHRIPDLGWTVTASIPVEELDRPLREVWFLIAGLSVIGLFLSLGCAAVYGRHLFRAFDRLDHAASNVGRGEAIEMPSSGVRELDKLGQTLAAASKELNLLISQRADLHGRLINAEEHERLRLSRELHDQIGQSLAAVLLSIKRIEKQAGNEVRGQLQKLRGELNTIGQIIHRTAWDLRPASIDELGLASALSNYVSQWGEQCAIRTKFHCNEKAFEDLPEDVRITIYRITQEALTNVAKHATGAIAVTVVLSRVDGMVRLTVEDNGCGFDTASEQKSKHSSDGLGLVGMRERLSVIGGELEIESSVGTGTTIFARIPIPLHQRAA